MTDLAKTLERLEGFEAKMADQLKPGNVIPVPGNPVGFDPFHFYSSYAQVCDAICAVRQEIREEGKSILIADWDEDTMDWNANPGEIICPKHGRQEAITVRPGKWDCKVCNTPPPAEPPDPQNDTSAPETESVAELGETETIIAAPARKAPPCDDPEWQKDPAAKECEHKDDVEDPHQWNHSEVNHRWVCRNCSTTVIFTNLPQPDIVTCPECLVISHKSQPPEDK